MSSLIKIKKKCIVCGHEQTYTVVEGTNALGPMDLDTRPPQMKRSTLPYDIQFCEHCHYSNNDISALIDGLKIETIQSSAYTQIALDKTINPTAKAFLLAGYLYSISNHSHEAGLLYLNAAWVFDDLKNDMLAKRARKKAVENILKYVDESEDLHLAVLTVDLFRRLGEFGKAKEAAEELQEIVEDSFLGKILRLQLNLIAKQDTSCHNVSEVE